MFGGFGWAFGGQQQRNNERPRGQDVHVDIDATLEQLYNGHSFEVGLAVDDSVNHHQT